jgi:hypothetical protein
MCELSDAESSEWPGTKLLRGTARLLRYSLLADSGSILARLVSGLYDWRQPSMPEDLCLIRQSGEPWLVTISHERDAYLRMESDEWGSLVAEISGLRSKKDE